MFSIFFCTYYGSVPQHNNFFFIGPAQSISRNQLNIADFKGYIYFSVRYGRKHCGRKRKIESTGYQHFLLFPQCLQQSCH